MKKLLTITVLMALAMSGFAQNQYDFSAVCESGQTLYYRITDAEAHTVILTHPYRQEGNPSFQGDYYEGYVKPEGEIIISSVVTYNGTDYTVTAIDSNSFWDCIITSIFIPNTVNHITPRAFGSCTSLESISVDETNPIFYSENNTIIRREDNALVVGCKTSTIPEGIEIICQQAIYAMDYSGVLTIPNSVRIIENGAFAYNLFSGSLALPESLETLGSMAFYASGFSGSLTMPNSVTEIGHHAFYGCRFSGSLTLSSSLSTIENCAFADCQFSGTLVIPNSVNLIVGAAFSGNNFSELVLGESVATIESIAFLDCNNLTGALRLPASLTQIDQLAFKNTSFNEIYSPNRMPPTLNTTDLYPFAFDGYDTSTPIHIPFGCTEAYQNAEGWNYFTNFIEASAPVVPDLYTIGYKDNNSATRTAKLYKNNALLHSIRVTGKQVTPYKIANDSEGNIYWMVVYSANSSTLQTEIWKNDELYLSTEGHNGVTIKDIYCLGDTLFYVGNTTTEEGIKVATVWTGNDFTPHWVLGDGVHNSFIYDADVDRNTNIPYYCGYVSDSINKASVWKASQLLYKYEPSDTSQGLSSAYQISIDNGIIYTLGRSDYTYEDETYSYTVIWRDNECICSSGAPWDGLSCLYANKGAFYFVFLNHDAYNYTVHINGYYDELFNLPMDQGSISCITSGFDDIYMVGKLDNHGCIWKNFELLLQHNDCNVITDLLAVEATDVNTTFDEPTDTGYAVYPNPTNSVLFVETQHTTSLPAKTEYRITNLMGQTLLQGHITAEKQQINIDHLPAGMYFITYAGETQKFVIE